jgi:hypothetical protein
MTRRRFAAIRQDENTCRFARTPRGRREPAACRAHCVDPTSSPFSHLGVRRGAPNRGLRAVEGAGSGTADGSQGGTPRQVLRCESAQCGRAATIAVRSVEVRRGRLQGSRDCGETYVELRHDNDVSGDVLACQSPRTTGDDDHGSTMGYSGGHERRAPSMVVGYSSQRGPARAGAREDRGGRREVDRGRPRTGERIGLWPTRHVGGSHSSTRATSHAGTSGRARQVQGVIDIPAPPP